MDGSAVNNKRLLTEILFDGEEEIDAPSLVCIYPNPASGFIQNLETQSVISKKILIK